MLDICFKVPEIHVAIDRVIKEPIGVIDRVAHPGSRNGCIVFMNRDPTEQILLHLIRTIDARDVGS